MCKTQGWMGAGLLAAGLLAGCVTVDPVNPAPGQVESCGASELQSLVGQDIGVISGIRFSQPLRVYKQGDPVTMDFNPARLNIETGPGDVILRVSCG